MNNETPHLLETCQEGGTLTELQMREALAGHARHPLIQAIVSKLEYDISNLRDQTETPGTPAQQRDEKSGAIHELKVFRRWLIEVTAREMAVG